MLGFRGNPSHPVTDKGIEQFAESDQNGIELFPNLLFAICGTKSGRGHGGFLTNPTDMMCRGRHRKARRIGAVPHKREIYKNAGSRMTPP